MDRITINKAIQELSISRSTLYRHMRQLGIKAQKDGKKSYITKDELDQLSHYINQRDTVDTQENPQVEDLKGQLQEERRMVRELTLHLGQWQGRAKTLEEQNIKLIEYKETEKDRTVGLHQKKSFFQHMLDYWR